MTHDRQKLHRRSLRLKGYDYTQPGAYFITLVARDRESLFGEVVNGKMRFNDGGRVAERCWLDIPLHFAHVALGVFVIMPNHVHGILWIVETPPVRGAGAKNFSPLPSLDDAPRPHGTSKTIGSVARGFKTGVTKWFRQNTPMSTVWQRNYYEHIIRDEESLKRIREYIVINPLRWQWDRENPDRIGEDDAWDSLFQPSGSRGPTPWRST